jgi:hypothetical protein
MSKRPVGRPKQLKNREGSQNNAPTALAEANVNSAHRGDFDAV